MKAFVYVLCAIALVGLAALATSCGTVPQSEVGFQVGGGPLDRAKNKVKSDLLDPGRHVLGTLDSVWTFPAYRTLRFLDFDVPVTTLDGKKTTIRGQMAFRFVGEQDPKMAREFAEGIGSRRYTYCTQDSCERQRAGEGDEGWTGMLNQLAQPEIAASLKDGFGRVYCADFEPACRAIDPRKDVPQSDPEKVYDTISRALQDRIDTKFMGSEFNEQESDGYLRNVRIRVQAVTLPDEVQENIDRVTEEQAKTKAAQQAVKTADAEAQAIRTRGKALRANPQQIAVEVAKVCQGGEKCSIIVDAAGGRVQPSVRAGR